MVRASFENCISKINKVHQQNPIQHKNQCIHNPLSKKQTMKEKDIKSLLKEYIDEIDKNLINENYQLIHLTLQKLRVFFFISIFSIGITNNNRIFKRNR